MPSCAMTCASVAGPKGMRGDQLLCVLAVLWCRQSTMLCTGDPLLALFGGCAVSHANLMVSDSGLWGRVMISALTCLENRQLGDGGGDAGRSVAVSAGCIVGGDSTAVFGCYWGVIGSSVS